MENTSVHAGVMETQLRQWGAKLDQLGAEAVAAGASARADHRARLDEIGAQLKVWGTKLDEFVAEVMQAGALAIVKLKGDAPTATECGAQPDPRACTGKRYEDSAAIESQLKIWKLQLDALAVGYGRDGAAHDGYHIHIDDLRTRYAAVQARLVKFNGTPTSGEPWEAFRAAIAADWSALEAGCKSLPPQSA